MASRQGVEEVGAKKFCFGCPGGRSRSVGNYATGGSRDLETSWGGRDVVVSDVEVVDFDTAA